jgi:hypothetical protein
MDSMRVVALLGLLSLAGESVCAATRIAQSVPRARQCFVDEGSKDPGFMKFRQQLLEVARKRDIAALLRLTADDVQFSGEEGKAKFASSYLSDQHAPTVFKALDELLRLGGIFEGPDMFCAPYTRCAIGSTNTHEAVILGERVPAYAAPSTEATVMEVLSCDIVRISGDDIPEIPTSSSGWSPVFLGQQWAFVEDKFVRLTGDWYAVFAKRGGQWRLIAFSAGD